MKYTQPNATRIFWIFALSHVVLWTLVPTLSRHELDTDSMMHFAWGQEWMGSYHLHPPILPWVVAGFLELLGPQNWSYNLLTQLNFLLAFYCIWRLAREVLPPIAAVTAVLLLEFIPYFSIFSMRLNHSSMLISIWAATILLAFLAITRGQNRYWIGLGILAALAMLTKYYSAAMLPGIALYLLLFKEGRLTLKTIGPYLSLIIFVGIMGWHIWYVFDRELGTIGHVADYVGDDFSLRWSGIRFLLAQALYLVPLSIVYFSIRWRGRHATQDPGARDTYQAAKSGRRFIYWMFLFPLLGTAIVAFSAGIGVSSRWGGPTLNLAGIVALLVWPIPRGFRGFDWISRSVGVWLLGVTSLLLITGAASSDRDMYHFPGKELATEITQRWRDQMGIPLRIVGGGHVAPDSIAFHSSDHPSVLQHLSYEWSPWITPSDIRDHGMAIVCLKQDQRCQSIAKQFIPDLTMTPLTVRAKPGLFFPGSERSVYYFFVAPNGRAPDLQSVPALSPGGTANE